MFAQWQQGPALWLDVRRQVFPFRATYRTEENGVGSGAGLHGGRRQRVAGGINGGTAYEVFSPGDLKIEFGSDGIEDQDGLGHDFRSDAVAGEDGDAVLA